MSFEEELINNRIINCRPYYTSSLKNSSSLKYTIRFRDQEKTFWSICEVTVKKIIDKEIKASNYNYTFISSKFNTNPDSYYPRYHK